MKNKIRTYRCVGCGIMVTKSCTKNVKFCTPDCYHAHKPKNKAKTGGTLTCIQCGNPFYVPLCRVGKAIACSVQCLDAWQGRNKVPLVCKICKQAFKVSPATIVYDNRQYCSLACRNADPDLSARLLEMRTKQSTANPNKFEKLAYSVLDSLGIEFVPQYIVNGKFTVDAFIPSKNIVIQFDGDYWHGKKDAYPSPDHRQAKRMALDVSQDAYMKKLGITVVRFWESDFKNIPAIMQIINSL